MDLECMEKINHHCQINKLTLRYDTAGMTGPSHDPEFTVVVKLNGVEYGRGTGKSKKEAKRAAAKKTWEMIKKQSPSSMDAAALTTTQRISSPERDRDYVSLLNIVSQRELLQVDYPERNRTGDAHAPILFCSCTINGQLYGRGTGPTLAAAKQAAAKQALEKVNKEGSLTVCMCLFLGMCLLLPPVNYIANHFCVLVSSKEMPLLGGTFLFSSHVRKMAHYKFFFYPFYRKLAANFPNVGKEVDMNTRAISVDKIFLNHFENIEPIGEGGFGNVFKARSKCDKITYAIKRVEFTKYVLREAEGLARLTHENIVRYHWSWTGHDRISNSAASLNSDKTILCLFIQMEFCEKGTLEKWIMENREDKRYHEMAQNKFLQIMKGVEYIHSEKLIHRDLKPPNIFISHDDKIKIGDFGLVTFAAYETLTENTGTKSYMAPEQFSDRYGKEVDIYALGLIWFEILSAFTNHEKSEVWPSVRKGDLPGSFTKKFPPKASIIKEMLSKDPFKRPSASRILDLVKSIDKEKSRGNYTY
ncbi:E2AK2 kinase, partial [Tyrannus savana]|nr:E2AK2 kinase [Tyrannus savana]